MTQEQKDLLLKELCARLPYEVKIYVDDNVEIFEGINILDNVIEYGSWLSCEVEEVKPLLFPLSSMTEEQKDEYDKMTELDIEYTITQIKNDSIIWNDSPIWTTGLNRYNWLIKNHFDIYGLIPMGLAIDATGLDIY